MRVHKFVLCVCNTLNFAPLEDLASIISIYNDSTVNHDSKLVYLYGKFELSRITQNQDVLVRAPQELLDDSHFTLTTFGTAQVKSNVSSSTPPTLASPTKHTTCGACSHQAGWFAIYQNSKTHPRHTLRDWSLATRCITPPRRCKSSNHARSSTNCVNVW